MVGEKIPQGTIDILKPSGGNYDRFMADLHPFGHGSRCACYVSVRIGDNPEKIDMQQVEISPYVFNTTSHFAAKTDYDLMLGEGVKLEIDGKKLNRGSGIIHIKEGQKIRLLYNDVGGVFITPSTEMVWKPEDEIDIDEVELVRVESP